jgi:ABC-type bacteriocin/lantibiotic exporter with double-glycine peptidase domain
MALISIALFLYSLKIKWINLSLLSLIVLITYGIYIVGESRNQAIIHHYQNQGVVDIIIGNKAYQLNTNKLEQNAIQRITSRFRRMHHVNEVEDITTEELCQLVE